MFNPFEPRVPVDPSDPFAGLRGAAQLGTNAFMLVFILVNSAMAGVAAILGGPLLFAFTKFTDWDTNLRLGRAWGVAFMTYFGYFCISSLVTMGGRIVPPPVDSLFAPEMLVHITMLHGPAVLVAAAILLWRLPAYRSFFGFVRAVFFVCFSLLLSATMMYLTTTRIDSDGAPGIGYAEGFAMIGLITLVIVVPGSIFAALVIRLSAALGPRPDKPLRFLSVFWTSIVVLLSWIASVATLEFLFMTSEHMFAWYQAYHAADDPAQYLATNGFELRVAIIVAASILLVSILVAGSVLTSRLSAAFPGRLGWLRAVLTTGVAVAGALAPITALLLWAYSVGGFDDMDMYW